MHAASLTPPAVDMPKFYAHEHVRPIVCIHCGDTFSSAALLFLHQPVCRKQARRPPAPRSRANPPGANLCWLNASLNLLCYIHGARPFDTSTPAAAELRRAMLFDSLPQKQAIAERFGFDARRQHCAIEALAHMLPARGVCSDAVRQVQARRNVCVCVCVCV